MIKFDQDLKQKISSFFIFLIEFYRVITSSLVILFVPQKCNNSHVCSLKENLEWTTKYYNTTLIFNFITLFSFFIMYIFEMYRENLLIKYLDVNQKLPSDNDEVGKILEKLPEIYKLKILKIDKNYQKTGYISMFLFVVNSFLSGFCLYDYYLNNQTTTTFITYLLFMIIKLANVWSVIRTEQNIFYSSYLKTNIQFNDIDRKINKQEILNLV